MKRRKKAESGLLAPATVSVTVPAVAVRPPVVWPPVVTPPPCKIAEITHVGDVNVADIRQMAGPDQGYAAWYDAGGAVVAYNRPFGGFTTIRGVINDPAATHYKVSYSSDGGTTWNPILARWTERKGCWFGTWPSWPFTRDSHPDGWLTIENENRSGYPWFLGCDWNGRLIGWDIGNPGPGGWSTSALKDGKYMLKLTVRYGGEKDSPTQDSRPVYVQLDNTRPEICIPFKKPTPCEAYSGKIGVIGGVYDEHFNHYDLYFAGGDIFFPILFRRVRWNDGYPGVGDKGTGKGVCDVELGIWDPNEPTIDAILKQWKIPRPLRSCCYSISMWAYDRSIVNDGKTSNWTWAMVHFSYKE